MVFIKVLQISSWLQPKFCIWRLNKFDLVLMILLMLMQQHFCGGGWWWAGLSVYDFHRILLKWLPCNGTSITSLVWYQNRSCSISSFVSFSLHAFSPRLLLCAHPITGSGSKFSKVTGKLYFKTLLQLKLRILLSQSFNKLNLKYYFGGLLTGPIIDCWNEWYQMSW